MGDNSMVIIVALASAEAEDNSCLSVTLSQRKGPYETMLLRDPDPPFVTALELASTSVHVLPLPVFTCQWDEGAG
jgi:hypothetical protein